MRVGLAFSDDFAMADQQRLAREVEASGFHSFWCSESNSRDGLMLALGRGAATSELHVGLGVASVWTRTAPQMAMACATLQDATDGRFILGLGTSHPGMVEGWQGTTFRKPLTAVREYLDILRQVESGGQSNAQGEVFASEGFRLRITPLPPSAPVYVAAMGPRMLAMAGKRADGVLLNWCSPEKVASSAQEARSGATSGERDPSQVDVASYVRFAVHEDRDVARMALAAQIAKYCALPLYAQHFERQGFADAVARVGRAEANGADSAGLLEALGEKMIGKLGWAGTPDESPHGFLDAFDQAGLQNLVARIVVCADDPQQSVADVMAVLKPSLQAGRLTVPSSKGSK